MKVKVITLGCKVNQYESQYMLKSLISAGCSLPGPDEQSDIVIVNSCTVTSTSDKKVRQTVHKARRENPSAVIVLTGCMPQAFPDIADNMADADIVLGNSNRSLLLPYVKQFLSARRRIIDISPHGEKFEPMSVENFYGKTRASVKIEDGCNQFCSYCIIPYARGRVRSKPLGDLKSELHSIALNGYKEVVLTGINLSAYGQEIGLSLCDAVDAACAESGIKRVRLGSLEPERLDINVVERLMRQDKLCPQFHLSLQSGCDETLKRMNRKYDSSEYQKIVYNLRRAFPNAAITTDIMVGFPGETDEDFMESLNFAKKIGFAKMHVFAYSRRPGTAANGYEGQIDPNVKEERSRAMIETARKLKENFFSKQVGLIEPVLFERECGKEIYEGYTGNYTPVQAKSDKNISGELINTKIIGVRKDFCMATLDL